MRALTWMTALVLFAAAGRADGADTIADLERKIEQGQKDLKAKEGLQALQKGRPEAILKILNEYFDRVNRAAANTAARPAPASRQDLLAQLAAKQQHLDESVNTDRQKKAAADLEAHRVLIERCMKELDTWLKETRPALPFPDFDKKMSSGQEFIDTAEQFRAMNALLDAEIQTKKDEIAKWSAELARLQASRPARPDPAPPSVALPPKSQPRFGDLRLEWPRKDELDRIVSNRDEPGLVSIEVRIDASELAAGSHHLVLAVKGGRESHLWLWKPAGAQRLDFKGSIPVPLGAQTVTISAPDHPEARAIVLNLVRVNPREAENEKWARDREAGIAKLDAQLANPDPGTVKYYKGIDGYRRYIAGEKALERAGMAVALIGNDRFAAALDALKDAEGLVVAAGTWGEPATVSTGFGVCTQDDIWRRRAQIAVATGDVALLREARVALVSHLAASAQAQVSHYDWDTVLYAKAGYAAATFADEMLMLGAVDPIGAKRLRDLALPYWRKAGAKDIDNPDWYPR